MHALKFQSKLKYNFSFYPVFVKNPLKVLIKLLLNFFALLITVQLSKFPPGNTSVVGSAGVTVFEIRTICIHSARHTLHV